MLRAEKQRLDDIAIPKPSRLNDASESDERPTPQTIGSNERKMPAVTRSVGMSRIVRITVAIGSPAFTVSTNDEFTLPNEPFVMQKPRVYTQISR